MRSAGRKSDAHACFLEGESGTSPTEYVLVAAIVAMILGLVLLALRR